MGLTDEEKDALVKYRLDKATEVFNEALDVASLNHWNLAVNRLYYSVFHACSAVLLVYGHNSRTHSGLIRIIMLNFVKTSLISKEDGRLIATLFNMRQTGDYDDLFDWDRQQVEPLIEPTRELLNKLSLLIKGVE